MHPRVFCNFYLSLTGWVTDTSSAFFTELITQRMITPTQMINAKRVGGNPLSTYAKLSQKLTFLTS